MGNVRMFLEDLVENKKHVSLDYIDTVMRLDYKFRQVTDVPKVTVVNNSVEYISYDDEDLVTINYESKGRLEIVVTSFSIK